MTYIENFYRGKKILITGGSKGIGLEISKRLLNYGAVVCSLARSRSGLNHPNFHEYAVDLRTCFSEVETVSNNHTGKESVKFRPTKASANEVILHLSSISFDILVNNVGSTPGLKLFNRMSLSDITEHLFLNINVHLNCLKIFKYKKVVFTNSILGFTGLKNNSIYCASKSFIRILNESLRREGVDSYIIHPAKVNTELFGSIKDILVLDKGYVADIMIEDIANGTKIRVIPFYYQILRFFNLLFPSSMIDWIFNKLLDFYSKDTLINP